MKNISKLILLTVSSLALAGCGGGAGNPNTSTDGPALTNQSIADGSIRPEVKAAIKESLQLIGRHEYTNDPIAHREYITRKLGMLRSNLSTLQQLSSDRQSQQERDFLNLQITALEQMIAVYSIPYTSEDSEFAAVDSVRNPANQGAWGFIQKYIQSSQLKNYLTQLFQINQKRGDEPTPSDLEKMRRFVAEFLAWYDGNSLDSLTRAEIKAMEELGFLVPKDIANMRRFANPETSPFSADVPNLSEKVSLRRARQGGAAADFSQLMLNGVAGAYAQLSTPLYVQVKGSVEGSKETKDLTGMAVYKLNTTLVGVIHGYANASANTWTSLNHNESSAVVSQSFGNAYLEGQVGFISSTLDQHTVSGGRYQVAAGYDFDAFTPFVQATTRTLNNVSEYAAYVGCELDVMSIVTSGYTVSSRFTVKGGYHSFKGTVGSIEGSGSIQLSEGVKIETAINLAGGEPSTAKIGFSLDQ